LVGREVKMVIDKTKSNIRKSLILLIFFLVLASPSFATTYYVLAGGTGGYSGTNWANANCKIPVALQPGDVVYVGNSGGNLADTTTSCAGEANHIFSTNGTSASHIAIKAATRADHGTATGWNAAYGVDATPKITWSNSLTPADGLKSGFWSFCPGSYYDIDGQVGTTDHTGTYGFYFRSAGNMLGFIKATSHDCSEASISNLTFKHIEIDGVEARSISVSGQGGSDGVYMGSAVSTTATVQSIAFSYFYIHDVFQPWWAIGNMTGLTLEHGYTYTNLSSMADHSQGLSASRASGGTLALNNLTVDDTVWKNIQGTAVLVCLDGGCNGWKIYNNIVYYSSDWDSICEHGLSTATCGMSKSFGDNQPAGVLTNSVVYGNTFSGIHLKPDHAGSGNAAVVTTVATSTGNSAEDNLWYNCTLGGAYNDGSNSNPTLVTQDYNTLLNTGYPSFVMALSTHDFQIGASGQTIAGTATDPFVSDSIGNFQLSSATVNAHLNDGVTLPAPYNVDYAGNARPGQDSTWERGAYEFSANAAGPNAPSNLQLTPR
jgi:hypothetical protein